MQEATKWFDVMKDTTVISSCDASTSWYASFKMRFLDCWHAGCSACSVSDRGIVFAANCFPDKGVLVFQVARNPRGGLIFFSYLSLVLTYGCVL